MAQQFADGRLGGRDGDVDLRSLHQGAECVAVGKRNHAASSQLFSQKCAHDVVFIAGRKRNEEVAAINTQFREYFFIGQAACHQFGVLRNGCSK